MLKTAPFLALLTLLCFGCDDDRMPGTDSGLPTRDAGTVPDAGTPTDSGTAADSGTDAGTPTCFLLSATIAGGGLDALDGAFSEASATWMRPTGEECPASGLDEVSVPFETVCYTNDTGAELGVTFEVLVGEEEIRPAAVVYDGTSIPTDRTQCAAVSSDLVIDAAEAYYVMPAGGSVTFVATLQQADTGTFQFVISPDEE
ncbi:MAG: hypothetical protein AB8I08_06550 [Sandaracinaceae bacterium]